MGSVVEDQDVVAKNKEIIKTKSVGELAHIGGLSDFPIPDNVENLYNKLTATSSKRPAPAAPIERPTSPQSFKETIYETLPRSMRETQLITNSKFEEDEERLKERQELTRTKSPTELSQISSVSDFPLPTPVENLLKKKRKPKIDTEDKEKGSFKIYDTLPASLTETKLMTKSVVEEPEVQAARAEVVKSKSVAELSQITTISDFPVPETIENLFSNKTVDRKQYAPAERRKKIKEQQTKSKSTQSLSQGMYASLPRHFTMELAVKTVEQEPDLVAERRELLASKSVSELSQVKSLADFPVPDVVQRVFHKSLGSLGGNKGAHDSSKENGSSRPPTSLSGKGLQAELYATLPRSLTEQQLLVRTKVEESAEVLQARQALVESKSPPGAERNPQPGRNAD